MWQDDEIEEIEFKMRVLPGKSLHDCYSINLSDEDFQIVLEQYDLEHLITENKISLFRRRKNIRFEVAASVLSDPWALADFGPEIKTFLSVLHENGLLRKTPKEKDNVIDDKPGRKKWELDGISIDDWAWEEVNIKGRNKNIVRGEWITKIDKLNEIILKDDNAAKNSKRKLRKLSNPVNSFNYAISKTRKNRLKNI